MTPPTPRDDDAAAADAVAWMVRLHSGAATPADHAEWQQWRGADPAHLQAWSRLDALSRRLQSLPGPLVQATLGDAGPRRSAPSRRAALKVFAGAGGLGLSAWSATQLWDGEQMWSPLATTHRTGVGQQARIRLSDGSRVLLNTATTLGEALDATQRCVWLRAGEVMVECVADARPFVLRTAEGELRAEHGRFAVRQWRGSTLLQVLGGGVQVAPRHASSNRHVRAGEQLRFDSAPAARPVPMQADATAWADGLIVANGMRLAELVDELSRYRHGWLRCDEAAGRLTISGVYPVTNPDRAIAALERTLPITARRYTAYWVQLRHT